MRLSIDAGNTGFLLSRGGSRKKYLGAWTLIIWEATTAKRNYYRTNYIKHVEKLGLNYLEKIGGGWPSKIWGAVPPGPNVEPPLLLLRHQLRTSAARRAAWRDRSHRGSGGGV